MTDLMGPLPINKKDPELFCESDRRDGQVIADHAFSWIHKNSETYRQLKIIIHDLARRGYYPITRDDVKHECRRRYGLRVSDDYAFKFANALWPGLVRYMIVDDPGLAGLIPHELSKANLATLKPLEG